MKLLLVLFLVCFCAVAKADDNQTWTTTDSVLQLTFASTLAVDAMQTVYFLTETDQYEKNPILGKHPSRKEVAVYNVAALVVHTGIAYALPKPYRTIWQSVWIGAQLSTITNNAWTVGGIKLKLP